MDTPMNFALLNEAGVVQSIIWLRASERLEFPNSICVEDRAVMQGDQYVDGEFYRNGERVLKYVEVINDLAYALTIIEEAIYE